MRIRRSALFVTQQITKTLLRKTVFATLLVAVMAGGAIFGQNVFTTPESTYAATPPDSCFAFSSGIITTYYDNEGNDGANPACPKSAEIPAAINGTAVTAIGDWAFASKSLTSITIPNSITSIGNWAFNDNQLSSLELPDSLTDIGNNAFAYNQLSSITLPSSLTTIANSAFYRNQLTSLNIPNGITTINDFAFYGNKLTEVTIPNSITSLGRYTFSANELTSVTIPNSLSRIDSGAFSDNKITSITIPSNITSIGSGAFGYNQLTSLTIPDTVTSMDGYVFSGNQLTSVTLGCGVNALSNELFATNKLREVTIPNCITSINPTTFFGQNPWGGTVEIGNDPDHDWYSDDPAVRKAVHDSIWYVVLKTDSATNPNHLSDGITDEAWWTGDINNDGDATDSIGGHLIDPTSVTTKYVDGANATLHTDAIFTGRLDNGTDLTDYLVKNVETPGFNDAFSPTPEEQASLEASLTPYHRVGLSVSLTAPSIQGYTLQQPSSPHTTSLVKGNKIVSFVYAALQTDVPAPNPPAQGSTSVADSIPTSSSTTSKTTTSAAPTTASDRGATIHQSKRTMIDFAAQNGPLANPTPEAVPSGLAAILANSRLETNEAKSCHEINSAKLLNDTSFSAPDTSYKTVGGLAFVLNCSEVAGDAEITFTLGEAITDLSKVKVYKQNAQGTSTDITSQITLTNQISSGHTTISYTLQDGQSFDDDGIANKSISDPIYIAVPTSTPLYTKAAQETPITQDAQQQTDTPTALIVTIAAAVAVTVLIVVIIRKKRRA